MISNSIWCLFFNQTCVEMLFTVFTDILQEVFIRNDKSELTVKQKWMRAKNFYRKIDSSMEPRSLTYQQIQISTLIVQNLKIFTLKI